MSEDPSGSSPQITDRTSGSNNGTSYGSMSSSALIAGKCGNALDFDGTDDFIDLGDVIIDGMTQFTIEAWVNPSALYANASPTGHFGNEGPIIHKSGASNDNFGITTATGGTAFYINNGADNTVTATAPTTSNWTHIAVCWDNSTISIYHNGLSITTYSTITGSFINNSNDLRFGGGHGNGGLPYFFTGIIDEIRISDINRSDDWIATAYNNQNVPSGFYTVSAEYTSAISCLILPIELIGFDTKINNNYNVELQWQTATEINNDYYTIERSSDAKLWTEITKINGSSNSSSILNYSYINKNPKLGLSYYRLKQTNFDGNFSYSTIKSVHVKRLINSEVLIYPNPSKDKVTIEGDDFELQQINIYITTRAKCNTIHYNYKS